MGERAIRIRRLVKNHLRTFLFGVISFGLLIGCTSQNCRSLRSFKTENAKQSESAISSQQKRIFVYKYDGSLQCDRAHGLSLAEMERDLDGVRVFSREKKADHLMRIQVCGAITGMANVYEISESDMTEAEKKGFKKWSFD